MSQKTNGRKQIDPEKTRNSIMRAAFKLFSEKGYRGASIADIADVAKVRKSLIQYHFGTKEQLWNACLEKRAGPMIAAIDNILASGRNDLGALVLTRYEFMRDNPEVRRLIAWAAMEHIPAPQFVKEKRAQLLGSFTTESGEGQRARLLFALAATDGWFHFRELYRAIAGDEVLSAEVEAEFVRLLAGVITKNE